jgi:hypothetical protein
MRGSILIRRSIHVFVQNVCNLSGDIQLAVGIHCNIRIKQPDNKFDRLTLSIVEFKNEWNCTYTSYTYLEKVDLDNFTFNLPFY